MKRMIRAAMPALAAMATTVALSGTGCQPTGVGDPCTPEAEYSTTFLGFNAMEVSTESADYQCFSRLCLVNHFQGRVSCPYGQDISGNKDWGQSSGMATAPQGCVTPYIKAPVVGSGNSLGATVAPQYLNRRSDQAVYCSCRCANLDGKTDDGAVYCSCPDGFSCTQLYSSIGGNTNQGLTGAYCIKSGSDYNPDALSGTCLGSQGNCGSAQGVMGM